MVEYPDEPDIDAAREHAEILAGHILEGSPKGNLQARVEMLVEALGARTFHLDQDAEPPLDRAVSPVVGVILLVYITVGLSAVVTAFALGFPAIGAGLFAAFAGTLLVLLLALPLAFDREHSEVRRA